MEIGKEKFENEKTAMQTDNFKRKEQPPTTSHPEPTEGRRRISTFRATTNYNPCAVAFDCRLALSASRAGRAQSYPQAQAAPTRRALLAQCRVANHRAATASCHRRSPK